MGPIEVRHLCPIFTHAQCLYLTECLGVGYRDLDHCEREVDCYGMPDLIASEASGAVDYDPSKVGECYGRFLASPCTFANFLFTPDVFDVLSLCPGTLTPRLTAGADCSSDGECVEGLYCDKPDEDRCPGVCRAYAAPGESCAGSLRCTDDLRCDSDVCVPYAKPGDPCSVSCNSSVDCPDGEICDGNLWCDKTIGECRTAPLVGEPCGYFDDGITISSAACALPLWCDAAPLGTGVCRAPSDAGGPCNLEFTACIVGLHCSGADSDTFGTCQPPSSAGGDCAGHGHCQADLVCIAGACVPRVALGGSCGGDITCAPGLVCSDDLVCIEARYPGDPCNDQSPACVFSRCVAGTCQYHAKVGESCMSGVECTMGACVSGRCYDTSVCPVP